MPQYRDPITVFQQHQKLAAPSSDHLRNMTNNPPTSISNSRRQRNTPLPPTTTKPAFIPNVKTDLNFRPFNRPD
ncbi:hypothetical protein HI914_07281 [Erysiphe necator]|nr:hypothetical protein HI914_07281 [Erysiphe necator]